MALLLFYSSPQTRNLKIQSGFKLYPCLLPACLARLSSPALANASRLLSSTLMKFVRQFSSGHWKAVWSVVRGFQARSRRSSAAPTMDFCISRSPGLPQGFPRGKSVNRKRATPHSSTTSLAEPTTTVGMPLASRWRATRLTVWWQTGQSAERSATSTASSFIHVSIWGASFVRVTPWL